MEKRTPHCKSTTVKKLIAANKAVATDVATADARALGVKSLREMCEVVLTLEPGDFYKSTSS